MLESVSVSEALEALRQANPLEADHPLTRFVSIRQQYGGSTPTDAAIFATLTRLIRSRLRRLRALHGLSPSLSSLGFAEGLRADFQAGSDELEAWSMLYHRYVLVDAAQSPAWSPAQIGALVGQSLRTLNRRQQHGIFRLTHLLLRREMRAHTKARKLLLQTRLPVPYPPKLVGRDVLLTTVWDILNRPTLPRHVLLFGTPGIGKTAIALNLAHALIDNELIADVAWLDAPELPVSRLVEAVALALELPTAAPVASTVRNLAQQRDLLIVLDHAGPLLADPAALREILLMFGRARLIVCHTAPPAPAHSALLPDMHYVAVRELDHEAALTLLEQFEQQRQIFRHSPPEDQPGEIERFAQIERDLGGNPRALRRAIEFGPRHHPRQISVEFFDSIWEASPEAARLAWLILAICARPLAMSALEALIGSEDVYADLCRNAVVDHDGRTGTITPLARLYAEQAVTRAGDTSLARLTWQAIRRVAAWLAMTDDTAIDQAVAQRVLDFARRALFSLRRLLDLAYAYWPIVERAGAWQLGKQYLDPLYRLLETEPDFAMDRLWVGLRLGVALRWLADWNDAAYVLAHTMDSAGTAGQFDTQAEAMLELAAVYRMQQEYTIADELLHRVVDHYQRQGDAQDEQRAAVARVQVALESGNIVLARLLLRGAGVGDLPEEALSPRLLSLAAQVALRDNQPGEALRFAEQAHAGLADELPNRARLTALLGQIHYKLGNFPRAVDYMTWAITTMQQTNDLLGAARARLNLGIMFGGQGRLRSALRYLRPLPAELQRLGDLESLQTALHNLEVINRALQSRRGNSDQPG